MEKAEGRRQKGEGARVERLWRAAAGVLLVLIVAVPAWSQPAAGRVQQPGEPADPAEVNRLFDAYAVMQAQEMLHLDDSQFGTFVRRLRALQEARRRHLTGRAQIIRDIQRRLRQPDADEAALRDRLDELSRHDASALAAVKEAIDAIDEMLDIRQRARFRVFEHQLELKKLELLGRVRQQIRGNRPRP